MNLIIRFWKEYASIHKYSYILGIIFLLLTNSLGVLIPKLIQWSIEAFEHEESAVYLSVALLGAGVATMVVRTLSRTFIFNPGRTVEYALKKDLFAHLIKLPKAFYEAQMTAGEMINRGTNDTAAVRGLVGFGALQLFNVSMTLTLTLGQMFWLDVWLSLYCVIPLTLASLVLRWAVLKMFTFHRQIMSQNGVFGDRILESYAGVSLIQLFGANKGVNARFDQENDELLSLNEQVQTISVWALPIVSVIGNLCVVLTLYLGGSRLQNHELSLGALTAFIVYINLLVSSLTSLGWLTGAIQRGYISLGRVYEVLDAKLDRPVATASLPPCQEAGRSLEVKNLSFTHPTAELESLHEISFSVKAGEVLGIFGLTGSGKSTLLDVLSRTYDPPSSTVFVDETDITQLEVTDYWKELAYVQQSPFLFSQSIKANITLSADELSAHNSAEDYSHTSTNDERLAYAIDAACLSGEIESFPQQLMTKVGERGITLSGGQKQRTSLARAFYRENQRLLLLDDVLSAVDHQTEERLIQAIYNRQPACTTLIVSHRMSVLQRADRVIVLNEGQVVDQGTPQELIHKSGPYADAWQAQNSHEKPSESSEQSQQSSPQSQLSIDAKHDDLVDLVAKESDHE